MTRDAAARLVFQLPKYSHVTPLFLQLHWLPIRFRITFKILLVTFKAVHGMAPPYLSSLVSWSSNNRYNLRSSSASVLKPLNLKTLPTLGDRAFQAAAPKLWNQLPKSIHEIKSISVFKKSVKTHLFKLAFNC